MADVGITTSIVFDLADSNFGRPERWGWILLPNVPAALLLLKYVLGTSELFVPLAIAVIGLPLALLVAGVLDMRRSSSGARTSTWFESNRRITVRGVTDDCNRLMSATAASDRLVSNEYLQLVTKQGFSLFLIVYCSCIVGCAVVAEIVGYAGLRVFDPNGGARSVQELILLIALSLAVGNWYFVYGALCGKIIRISNGACWIGHRCWLGSAHNVEIRLTTVNSIDCDLRGQFVRLCATDFECEVDLSGLLRPITFVTALIKGIRSQS